MINSNEANHSELEDKNSLFFYTLERKMNQGALTTEERNLVAQRYQNKTGKLSENTFNLSLQYSPNTVEKQTSDT